VASPAGRSRVTLWADGTLRRDSSFHTKQVNLNGCRDFRIEDEGELTFGHGDRVFSAAPQSGSATKPPKPTRWRSCGGCR
jgi:hypothetical protein